MKLRMLFEAFAFISVENCKISINENLWKKTEYSEHVFECAFFEIEGN